MPRSIRARILLGSVITILVALGVVAAAVPSIATQHEMDVLGARLASEAKLAGDLSRELLVRADADALDLLAKRIASNASVRVTFVGMDGTVLGESDEDRRTMDNHGSRPEIVPALAGGEGRAVRFSATVGRDLLYVAVPLLQYMTEDTSTIDRATWLLWVAHNLERMGDRIQNICERTVYEVTGVMREFTSHTPRPPEE